MIDKCFNTLVYVCVIRDFRRRRKQRYIYSQQNLHEDIESTTVSEFLVLTIFNEGAYFTFKSILHKALNLF